MSRVAAHIRSSREFFHPLQQQQPAGKVERVDQDVADDHNGKQRAEELCPRALHVLKRHLALRARLKLAGKINHDELFCKDDGTPCNARHSSVSWNLMIGKNPLWVAKQHGHSVQTMLETYAAWLEGTSESDLAAIRKAMAAAPAPSIRVIQGGRSSRDSGHFSPSLPLESPRAVTTCHWKGSLSCNCLTTGSN